MGAQLPLPFGRELRRLRNAAGLTQEQLGHKVGLAGVTIRAYENGSRRPPHPDDLARFCAALGLAEAACMLLTSAAKRARAIEAGPDSAGVVVDSTYSAVPGGVTQEAREKVARFNQLYRRPLSKAMATQLSIVVCRPMPEPNGPIAAKREDIRAWLQRLGHQVVWQTLHFLHEQRDGEREGPAMLDPFEHADLIVIVAEDDPTVVDQVMHFCQRMEMVPKIMAMLPERFEPLVEADLDVLISGYMDVFWYDDDDVQDSNLVKRSVRCSEARRKVKAFQGQG